MYKKTTWGKFSLKIPIAVTFGFCFANPVAAQVDVSATAGTPTATYTNLSSAFAAINAGTHMGDINVGISASFTDVATAILNSSGSGPASYTSVAVMPTVDGVIISFASATGRGVIELNGADNVTIDGDNPNTAGTNRNLTINNTAAATTSLTSVIRVAAGTASPELDNNNIALRNLILNGSATGQNNSSITSATGASNNTFGIVVGPNGGPTVSALTSETAAMDALATANSFNVDNCAVNQCGRGIAFMGGSVTGSNSVVIANNHIGNQTGTVTGTPPFTGITTTVYNKGIFVQGTNAVYIASNTIKNIISYTGVAKSGIELGNNIGNIGTQAIDNNTIDIISHNAASSFSAAGIMVNSAGSMYRIQNNSVNGIQGVFSGFTGVYCRGIFVNTAAPSGTIEMNRVSNIYNYTGNTLAAYGIQVAGGNNVTLQNNTVRDIQHNMSFGAAFSTDYAPIGILLTGGTGHKVYYNTVKMSGTPFGTSTTGLMSAAFAISNTGVTGTEVLNNLFSNTIGGTGGNSAHVSIFLPSGGTTAMNLNVNNNAYYSGATAGLQGIAQVGAAYAAASIYSAANFNAAATTPTTNLRAYSSTLSAMGTNDNASVASTMAAPFVSATDLHIDAVISNAVDLDGKGVPVMTTTTDIDLAARNATTPDIGADEFDIIACSTPVGGTIPTSGTICSSQTQTLNAAGATVAVGITYQWEVSSTGGGTGFASVTGGTGATTVNYNTGMLAPGVYYYRLAVTCSTGPSTDYSNEFMLTVDPTPTASASAGPACIGNDLELTGTTDIGTSFSWTGPMAYASTSQNPVITGAADGVYTFVATLGSCPSAPATVNIVNRAKPTGVMANATSTVICHGNTVDLTSAGNPYSVTLLSENFNGATTPAGWSAINNSTGGVVANAAWTLRPNGYNTGGSWGVVLNSNDASQFYLSNSDAQGSAGTTNTILQTPALNTTGFSTLTLNFFHYFRYNAAPDAARVEVSTDGTMWTTVQTYTSTQGTTTTFANPSINLNAYVGFATVYVRFRYSAPWGYGWAIDNVSINGGSNAFTYDWTSMPAGFMSADQNPTGVMVNDTTEYMVTLTNIFGCSEDASVTVNTQGPDVTATSDALPGNIVCNGSMLTLTGTGTADSYTWDMGVIDGAAFTPADTATYIVTGVETATGCVDRDTITIYVNNVPTVAAASDDADNAICDGSNVTLTGSGADSYAWDNSVTDGVAFMPAATTTYTVTGTTDGCSNTASITITVNDLPTVTANSDDADNTVCSGTSVTLTGGGASTYTWDNSVMNGVSFSATTTTTYTVTGTDVNGCENTASLTLNVNTVNVNTSTSGLTITAAATPATYVWIDCGDAGSIVPGSTSNSFTATANGSYAVVVTQNGCTDTSTCVTITGIGINEISSLVFDIYPNPSSGDFMIESDIVGTVTILNLQGEVVMNAKINTGKNQMTAGDIARGMYLVKLLDLNGNTVGMQRLVIAR